MCSSYNNTQNKIMIRHNNFWTRVTTCLAHLIDYEPWLNLSESVNISMLKDCVRVGCARELHDSYHLSIRLRRI